MTMWTCIQFRYVWNVYHFWEWKVSICTFVDIWYMYGLLWEWDVLYVSELWSNELYETYGYAIVFCHELLEWIGLELCYMISLFVYGLLSFWKLTLCVFALFYRYRSYCELGDRHHTIEPYFDTLKMYILKYGMYTLEMFKLCFVMYIYLAVWYGLVWMCLWYGFGIWIMR